MTSSDNGPSPDDLMTVAQVRARLPGKGRGRIHPATITRWILQGCPSRSGTRVKLLATRAGSHWLIRSSDLEEFFASLAEVEPVVQARPKLSNRESEFAARELERRGA